MDAIEAIKTRRSVRAYTLKPVERAVVEDIVDCARLAPTGMNLQPWDFIVVTDMQQKEDLADLCAAAPFLAEAPVAIAVVCRKQGVYVEDASCAVTCLMLAARAYGLGTCWFNVLDKPIEPAVRSLLDVSDDRQVICVVSVGYGELPPSPDKRDLQDVLHWDRWGGKDSKLP